jgi:signal transduction histidine kinase
MEVRAWLREWCGISIYRDSFRVWPYGEPHDDWLRLDLRRVNNPVVCLSNNQVVGFVEVSQRDNPDLRDQTNREGLIHNQALDDLRKLMHFVLQLLESERQSVRHPDGRARRAAHQAIRLENLAAPDFEKLRKLAETAGGRIGAELRGVASRLEAERDKREAEERLLIEHYALLAARGHTIASVSAGIREMIESVRAGVLGIRSGVGDMKNVASIQTVEKSISELESRLGLIAGLTEGGANRRRAIEVPVELKEAERLYGHLMESKGMKMRVQAPRADLVRVDMAPESLRLLLHTLVENSLDWPAKKDPTIRVGVAPRGEMVEILYSDNGPGISPSLAERVFDPSFSLKEGGQGLGLTIARNLVTSHGGNISVVYDGRRKKGTTFRILLPRKRSRATRETGHQTR